MLKIQDIVAGYSKAPVLQGVTFEVMDGECTCLVGANGAGKSTLMKIISGLIKPFSGSVIFDGKDLVSLSTPDIVDLGIIQVPEGRQLFPKMTVLENLILGGRSKRARSDVKAGLERVDSLFPVLGKRRKQVAGTLSGGEQQMLAIGRGLMGKPRILLMDEPSIGLSPILVIEILGVVKDLVKDGITVLLVEQNVRASLAVASHGFLLERGRVVLGGASKDLLESDAIKKGYIGG